MNPMLILLVGQIIASAVPPGAQSQSAAGMPSSARRAIPPAEEFYQAAAQRPVQTLSALALGVWRKQGDVLLIDLRNPESYRQEHLPGAINLPLTDLTEKTIAKIAPKKSTRIVIYCDNSFAPSRRVALTTLGYAVLRTLGYEQSFVLEALWDSDEGKALLKQTIKVKNTTAIGTATMRADGTITLQLRAESSTGSSGNPAIGDALIEIKADDPRYRKIIEHIEGIKPGESRPVTPWDTAE
jgi:hypothetical protein